MHITMVGTGYVGLVTGACFSEFGVFVTCVDKDPRKIEMLKNGEIPFYEPGLEDLVKRNVLQGRLKFTTELSDAIDESLVIFIAVGTPPKDDGSADLSYVDKVAEEIALNMKGYKVIVTKSTVPVGTGSRIRKIIENTQKESIAFDVVSNPEFLREGAAIEDFMRPNRVVLGASSSQSVAIMKDLYRPLYLLETPFVITNVATAELIKYASNSFLATKISFINEMALLCEQAGADVSTLAKGMGLDGRIGTKFLHAGAGFGGSCFPKDTRAVVSIAEGFGIELKIVKAAVEANERQLNILIKKIIGTLKSVDGKTVAILGLSFKPNTDDIRESPALEIISALLSEGLNIRAYDPVSMDNTKVVFPDITYCQDVYSACSDSDAVVIVTEWNQFRNLSYDKIYEVLRKPYFFDLRNIYDVQKMNERGFFYYSVGRANIPPLT